MLRNDEYEIIAKDVLIKEMVIKRDIKPGEQIDLSSYRYPIVLKGNIGEGAIVNATYHLTIEGDIGKGSTVSTQGFIVAKNIGEESNLKAGIRIEVCIVGQGVSLEARDNIKTLDVGSNCKLVSTQGQIRTGNVNTHTVINASHQVFSKDIREHTKINSEKSEVYVGNVYSHAEIIAFSNIHFVSIKEDVKLTPKHGQLMEQIDPSVSAFKPYVKSNPVNAPSPQQQSPLDISVNLENMNLKILSIEIPFNVDFRKLSESKTTLFAVKNESVKIESDEDKKFPTEKRTIPF